MSNTMNVYKLQRYRVWRVSGLKTARHYAGSKIITTPQNDINMQRGALGILMNTNGFLYNTRRDKTNFSYAQPYRFSNLGDYSRNNKHSLLLIPSITPQFHVRHFTEQAAEVNLGLWSRLFMWMSESMPVALAQDYLLAVHNTLGLPWWSTVVVSTIFLRTVVTLPLALYQNYILAKVENIQLLEMPELVKELKKETAVAIKQLNWTEKQARFMYNKTLQKEWNKLIVRDNCHPFKASVLLWVQIPMWIFLSVALRNLVYMLPHQDGAAMVTYMELSVGGFGWIPNLLVPDQSFILPVALGLVNLAIVELQTLSKLRKESKLQKYIVNIFRVLSLVMIPISASVPSCLCVYWLTSSTYGLVQNAVLLSPRVKKLTGIPETPSQLENPYKHIATEIRLRASRFPSFLKSKS